MRTFFAAILLAALIEPAHAAGGWTCVADGVTVGQTLTTERHAYSNRTEKTTITILYWEVIAIEQVTDAERVARGLGLGIAGGACPDSAPVRARVAQIGTKVLP